MADDRNASVNSDDVSGEESITEVINPAPVKEFVDALLTGGKKQIDAWFDSFNRRPQRFEAFLANIAKNRFPNIVLFDKSRVRLRDKYDRADYVHASWVDSYENYRGYILSQAPFDEATERDFWRMVAIVKPIIIVVLGATVLNDSMVMRKFWPAVRQCKNVTETRIAVKCAEFEEDHDHDRYDLIVEDREKVVATPVLTHYTAWETDKKLPSSLLEFRATVKILAVQRTKAIVAGEPTRPILIVCPTGVHRMGTFAGLDIIMDRIAAERKVGLMETVRIIREQRYGTFCHFSHYSGLADIVVRHAVSSNIVTTEAIAGKKP